MTGVSVVAAGSTSFGPQAVGIRTLFRQAIDGLTEAHGADALDRAGAIFVGSLNCGQGLQIGNFAPAMREAAGLGRMAALHVESACASGGYAFHAAVNAVASGDVDVAIAAGVEKMRDVSSSRGRQWLGVSGDTEYERLAGATFPAVFALIAARLIHDGVIEREDLAAVAVKNHAHAALNPKAHLRQPVTMDAVLAAPRVAGPLGLLDCCPVSDGAAVAVVAKDAIARDFTADPVAVRGIGASSQSLALHARSDSAALDAVRDAAGQAQRAAGFATADLDLVELHDCFTIAELLIMDALGICALSESGSRIRSGEFSLGGRLPVNVSGGLKAKGHPIGATGVGQIAELFEQLRGHAGERQVVGARRAMAMNMGGSGASAVVSVLESWR